jgi:hypothetical protein
MDGCGREGLELCYLGLENEDCRFSEMHLDFNLVTTELCAWLS